jgi:geranylgeranyl diphosphate synthase, type II
LNHTHLRRVYEAYRGHIEKKLRALADHHTPASVYRPIRYVLSGRGKRIRSLLVLFSCEAVGGNPRRALDSAAAMEILHNFTLVHDDVMDNSELRRGRPTVHKRWDPNIAILSGDELVALAYRSLLRTETRRLKEVLRVFTESFVEVCEGQALDKEFEIRRDVSLEEYLEMIGKKTGRIIAAATEIGGLVGGGTPREVAALRGFGEHLGRAFQIRDDLLDAVGDEEDFGKEIGSDIRERKKTYLFVTALERARGGDRSFLGSLRTRNGISAGVIERVQAIYLRTGTLEAAARAVERSTMRAQESLKPIKPGRGKELLLWLSQQLLERVS